MGFGGLGLKGGFYDLLGFGVRPNPAALGCSATATGVGFEQES